MTVMRWLFRGSKGPEGLLFASEQKNHRTYFSVHSRDWEELVCSGGDDFSIVRETHSSTHLLPARRGAPGR